MRSCWAIGAVVVSLLAGSSSQAFDTVKTAKIGMSGHVMSMTSVMVELQQTGSAALLKEIPVNQILTIYYEDDPKELKTAKDYVLESRYLDALTALGRIKKEPGRQDVLDDIEFYKAFCAAKLALAGSGKIADSEDGPGAGRLMKAFADNHPNSYHYFEASELVGDLLLAVRQYAQAADYYGRLAKAPWSDYQMRAGVALGRALLAQGKIDDALAAFDKVIDTVADTELAETQRQLATLGKADALVASKKPDEAIKLAEGVLKKVDTLKRAEADDAPLRAQAYNIEGAAHRQAGRVQEAILAFLHVEVFYASVPNAHAEALANLAELWEQVHKSERASIARQTLEKLYRDSPWVKKATQ